MTNPGQAATALHIPPIDAEADVLTAAFAYAKAGWYVGPIDQANKHAGSVLLKGWPAKTSRDPQDLAAWFAGTDHGIMLHVGRSGALCFDVDDYSALPEDLRAELDNPEVPFQSTRSGTGDRDRGHYLYAVPPGRQLGNSRGKLAGAWGEVRGRNGIIVASPTRHEKAASGGRYAWARYGPLPQLPDGLAAQLPDALDANDAATDVEIRAFLTAPEHSRRGKTHLVKPILDRFDREVASGASRHETALGCAVQMLKEARAGYYPAADAIRELEARFAAALAGERNAGSEYAGIVSWATAQAAAASVAEVKAITARTAQEYNLGARPAEAWPGGATPTRPAPSQLPVTPETGSTPEPEREPETVEEALEILKARTAKLKAEREGEAIAEAGADPGGDGDQMTKSSVHAEAAQPAETASSVPGLAEGTQRAEIDVTHDPKAITNLIDAVDAGAIPGTYVRQGNVVLIGHVSGGLDKKAKVVGPEIDVQVVDADIFRRLLAEHTDTVKWRAGKPTKNNPNPDPVAAPASPAVPVLKSVLTTTNWLALRPLAGVVTAPVLRPDGTLIQDPGYDSATGLYYSPELDVPRVPERPSDEDTRDALAFLLEEVLGDFPWKDAADLANYIALLMTPILRPYIGGLVPLGAISASERGSGKTLLTNVIGRLYRMISRPWVSSDEEIRKAITSVLMTSTAPVVLFDNVGDHDSVAAPSLAKLLTSDQWDDRILGGNNSFAGQNDRLWMVTGNQIEFAGDIAQRTVLVRLSPDGPDPDLRTGFTIPDLDEWTGEPENLAKLLHALLVLARSWTAAGAPREDHQMRGFKRWACGLGGFLAHHGIGKFLGNREDLKEHDEEAQSWSAFLAAFARKYPGGTWVTTSDLRQSAERDTIGGFGWGDDPWDGTFPTRVNDGRIPGVQGLGMLLKRHQGRFYGGYQLGGRYDHHRKVWSWAAREVEPAEAAVPAEPTP